MSADQPEDQAFVYEMGRRVRLHRLYRGLTQEQLGEQARLSRNFISILETGRHGIDVRALRRIAGPSTCRCRRSSANQAKGASRGRRRRTGHRDDWQGGRVPRGHRAAGPGSADRAPPVTGSAGREGRGTSPFPLAMLEFQRGQLWMEHDDLRRARAWCDAAVRRLPAYVPAQGHLAELDAALGEPKAAIARLRPLALASDDPDYATQLARILGNAGQTEEAQTWRGKAQARYDELLAHHHDAFADHAAEFWLTIGGDLERAHWLARQNLSLRQTPRARALVRRSSGHLPG